MRELRCRRYTNSTARLRTALYKATGRDSFLCHLTYVQKSLKSDLVLPPEVISLIPTCSFQFSCRPINPSPPDLQHKLEREQFGVASSSPHYKKSGALHLQIHQLFSLPLLCRQHSFRTHRSHQATSFYGCLPHPDSRHVVRKALRIHCPQDRCPQHPRVPLLCREGWDTSLALP
jgi:hypothetical protein